MGRSSTDKGIFVSRDGGQTWRQQTKVANDGNLKAAEVFRLLFDPIDPQVVYAATSAGLYRYGADTPAWKFLGEENFKEVSSVRSVAVNSQDSSIVFAATQALAKPSVIWKSTDRAESFSPVYATPSADEAIVDIHVDFYAPHIVFALTNTGSFLRSDDEGVSWRVAHTFDGSRVTKLIMDPNDSRNLYVLAESGGLFVSFDKGESWQNRSSVLENISPQASYVNTLKIARGNSSLLYLATNYGILRSNDKGRTFELVTFLVAPGSASVDSVEFGQSEDELFTSVGAQLYHSTDRGGSWQVLRTLDTQHVIYEILLHPAEPETIFVGVAAKK